MFYTYFSSYRILHVWICGLVCIVYACQSNQQENRSKDDLKNTHTSSTQSSRVSTQSKSTVTSSAYSQASKKYYQAGTDPLAALYQKSSSSPEKSFAKIQHKDPTGDFPKFMRTLIKKMSKISKVSVIQWDINILGHLKSHKPDVDMMIQWAMFDHPSKINKALQVLSVSSQLPSLQAPLQAEQQGERKNRAKQITWHLKRVSRSKGKGKQKQVWQLNWKSTVLASQTKKNTDEDAKKSCRFLHGINVVQTHPAWQWMSKRLTTTGDRRLTQWRSIYTQNKYEWQITWVYRNGRVRDRDIGRWVRDLQRKKATRVEQSGLQQSWQLSDTWQAHVEWWIDHSLPDLSCIMDRPTLAMSWSSAHIKP